MSGDEPCGCGEPAREDLSCARCSELMCLRCFERGAGVCELCEHLCDPCEDEP